VSSASFEVDRIMKKSPQTVLMKLHNVHGQTILAVCDRELLGRTLQWDEVPILISMGFFGGEEVTTDIMVRTATQCMSLNVFGKVATVALMEAGIISREAIVYIDRVPHCQVYTI
jgi:hypothetical protein